LRAPDLAALQARLALHDGWTAGYVSRSLWTDVLANDNGAALRRGQRIPLGRLANAVDATVQRDADRRDGVSRGSYVGFKIARKYVHLTRANRALREPSRSGGKRRTYVVGGG